MKRKITFYETAEGASPVEKFLRKQTVQVRKAVAAGFMHIQNDTNPEHLFRKMTATDGLWEIRIKQGGNIFRLLCFFHGSELIVVASGFQKKTQKTPRQEIKTAEARKKDYFRRQAQ